MRREAGAVHTLPNRANRPLNTAQRARDEVDQAERRLEAFEHATFEPIHSTTKDINMVVRWQ